MKMTVKIPLNLDPQPEGGYTVTSPIIRGLVTEGDTVEECMENVREALVALIESYEHTGDPLPPELQVELDDVDFITEPAIAIP